MRRSMIAAAGVLCLAASARAQQSLQPLADWAQRVHWGGNLAFEAFDGQRDASRVAPNAGFGVGPFISVLDADVADKTSLLWEFNVYDGFSFTGLLYVRFDDLLGREGLSARLGRVQIPFGEEYVRDFYPIDNPLVSRTVAFPWGYDVGAELTGTAAGSQVEYAVAALNGAFSFNRVDSSAKSYAGKVRWRPREGVLAALSALTTGTQGSDATGGLPAKSAFEFGESRIQPLGSSTEKEASARAVGADLVLGSGGPDEAWLSGGWIGVRRSADASGLDANRDLWYYSAEGRHNLSETIYSAVRWSSIASDVKNGVAETIAGENGWDNVVPAGNVRRIGRLSVGLGWRPSPRTVVKLEYAADFASFVSAPASPPRKNYLVSQVAVRF